MLHVRRRDFITLLCSAAARPMLQLARKVFDDSIIARPWRKPVTRWLASVSDALRRNPTTGIAGCCARGERPRHRRAAEQRDELAPCAVVHRLPSGTRWGSLPHA